MSNGLSDTPARSIQSKFPDRFGRKSFEKTGPPQGGPHFPVGPVGILFEWIAPGVSQSIKIGIDLSIDISIKIGKSDLIDIECIDQSVEIDDTLVAFIDLS